MAGRATMTFADQQIIGGLDWIRSDRFDISAKTNQGESSQKLLMLKTLKGAISRSGQLNRRVAEGPAG
jgi:hypothetical protein